MLDFSNHNLFRIARVRWLRCFPVLRNFLWNTFTDTLSLNQEERVICEGCRTDIKKENNARCKKKCSVDAVQRWRTHFSTKSPDEFSAHDFLPQRTVDLWLHFHWQQLDLIERLTSLEAEVSLLAIWCQIVSWSTYCLGIFAASFFWFDFRFLKEESPLYSSKNFNTVC